MNNLITVSGVTGYIDKNGTAQLKLEHVARGLGFTQTKNGVEYVKWERVADYLAEFGFSPLVGKKEMTAAQIREALPEFIPENIFYRLAFKASNRTAVDFQQKVADKILPAIRQTGFYGTPATIDTILSNPDTMIKVLTAYKTEKEGRAASEAKVKELTPKATYCDRMLDNPGLVPISSIAKDFGMSARTLNKMLHDYGVQYKQGKQWLIYAKYQDCGYVGSKPFDITHKDGSPDVKSQTQWTQKGRKFIYDLLKEHGTLPIVERPPFIKIKEKIIKP